MIKNKINITFLKTFIISFVIIMVIATPLFVKIDKVLDLTPGDEDAPILSEVMDFGSITDPDSPFFDAFTNKTRVNILVLGVEHNNLTDTIMLASFDIENKFIDIISIPRDTYYYRGPGYAENAHHKVNAVYRKDPVNTAKAVSEILMGMPINYYIELRYEGVEIIIDEIGGVPMDIPFNMVYNDPYETPPLLINIPKGEQVLDGKASVQFLRFRQANKGSGNSGYPDGDLGRIKAQQEFLKSAAKQCLSLNLPKIVETAFANINSDISIRTGLYLASKVVGIDIENIRTYRLPTKPMDVFEYPENQEIADMLTQIYSMEAVVLEEEEEEGSRS